VQGASLDQLLSYFIPNGYVYNEERSRKPLPTSAKELNQMISDGEGINAIASVG